MIKLEDVTNKAYFAMRKAQVNAMQTERLGKIHVSDVTNFMPKTELAQFDFEMCKFNLQPYV